MKDKVISDLFLQMYDGLHIFESGGKQMHESVQKNDAEIKKIVGEDNFLKIDELVGAENSAHAHYAFVTGFKYAMQILTACEVCNCIPPVQQRRYKEFIQRIVEADKVEETK